MPRLGLAAVALSVAMLPFACSRDFGFIADAGSGDADIERTDERPVGGGDADADAIEGGGDGDAGVVPVFRSRIGAGSLYHGVGFSCALRGDVVYCWGANDALQLGRADAGDKSAQPLPVTGPDGGAFGSVSSVSVGFRHACAIRGEEAYCWGADDKGQGVANRGGASSAIPIRVRSPAGPLPGARQVSANGLSTCVLDGAGKISCGGHNVFRQLTDPLPSYPPYATLLDDPKLTGARQIALGQWHGCAIAANKKVLCWGRNDFRQAGQASSPMCTRDTDTYPCVAVPTEVPGVTAEMIALGARHTCILDEAKNVRCWGHGAHGELGVAPGTLTAQCKELGSADASGVPCTHEPQQALAGASFVAVGTEYVSCALQAGKPMCWGSNQFGLLGQGANDTSPHPTPVGVKDVTDTAMSDVEELAVGRSHGCLWKTNSTIWCWGNEPSGAVGPGNQAAFLAREVTF